MPLIVFWSSALSLNSAAVHCLSKAINVCSSVILVFVCAEAITDAIATTNVSISIPVNFFICSNPFVVGGVSTEVEGFDSCASFLFFSWCANRGVPVNAFTRFWQRQVSETWKSQLQLSPLWVFLQSVQRGSSVLLDIQWHCMPPPPLSCPRS